MNYSTILFDLDGTLTDPKVGITKSVQYALRKYGILENDLDRLEPFIGPPLAQSFMELYTFSESEAKQAVGYYREYFTETGMYENEVYADIPDLLQELVRQERKVIVATSKPTVFAERILKFFQLDHYFDAVYGSNLDGTRSDKAEIIAAILEDRKLERACTIMIGDRKHDVIGAQRNDIASIGVLYGYGSEKEILEAKPTYQVRTVKELLALID